QAEDGIRDFHVTGVQTCALPIYALRRGWFHVKHRERQERIEGRFVTEKESAPVGGRLWGGVLSEPGWWRRHLGADRRFHDRRLRSEERRVGNRWKSRWSTHQYDE